MKKLIATFVLSSGLALAGPGYVITYPVLHHHQMFHAGHSVVKAMGLLVKAIVW